MSAPISGNFCKWILIKFGMSTYVNVFESRCAVSSRNTEISLPSHVEILRIPPLQCVPGVLFRVAIRPAFNLLKRSGYYVRHHVSTFKKFCVLHKRRVYVSRVDVRNNNDYFWTYL